MCIVGLGLEMTATRRGERCRGLKESLKQLLGIDHDDGGTKGRMRVLKQSLWKSRMDIKKLGIIVEV